MTSEEFKKAVITISKEELSTLPSEEYRGRIEVIDNLEKVKGAVEMLRKSPIIGFDTETRPSFRRGQVFNVALIQLSTPECCYLFRTNIIGFPQELISVLEDESLLKVGLSLHDDFHNIRRVREVEPRNFIDLQQFVKNYKIVDNSLTRVYGLLFSKRISKGQRLSNWEAPELSEAQQYYAALDAFACITIYDFLMKGNFDPSISKYLVVPPEQEKIIENNTNEPLVNNS